MPVPALAGGILSFASPKESIQRKGDPMPLASCALTVLSGFAGRDFLSLQQSTASAIAPALPYLLHPCSRNPTYATTNAPFPYAAPSSGGFGGNRPKGCGRDAARCWRDRKSLPATLVKTEERRKQAASGSPFLWILSFAENCSCIFRIHHIHVAWRSKRKYLVRGYENPH